MTIATYSTDTPFTIEIGRPVRRGLILIAIGFFGFVSWSMLAPLTSAVVANGIVVADSRNKSIQHLEGGIVHEILVREGQRVEAGQLLARLDSATASASLGRVIAGRRAGLAQEARLIAERDGAEAITFPKELMDSRDESETAEAIKGQELMFDAKRRSYESEAGIITQRMAQYEEEIRGLEAQISANDQQLKLIADELVDVRYLYNKGLERKPRLLELERTAADLGGKRGAQIAEIARAHQSEAEMEQQLLHLKAKRQNDAETDLRDIQTKLADFKQQLVATTDASRRLDIFAPVAGKVVSVYHQTPGGVVKPGETIMELLPDEDQLVIETQIRPEDIESVVVDQPVQIRLNAYNRRRSSALSGRVAEVSADRIVDHKGERATFLARVVVDAADVKKHPELKLGPGMPATVFIETGRETLMDYLLTPLFTGMEKGLRER